VRKDLPVAFDVIISGGTVLDGSGASPRQADVGIEGDRITAVDDLSAAEAAAVLDATGRVVTPGFVDTHTHTDGVPFLDHEIIKLASLRQGVTTEVCGNCGFSPFPCLPAHAPSFRAFFADAFRSLEDYRQAVEVHGAPVNLAPLVGAGYLRGGTMGFGNRAPTASELETMQAELDRAMVEGAFGLSSGLIYAPGMFATTDELIALATVVARYGRPYTTHMRNEADGVLESIEEALRIGREGGVPVHISHHKLAGRHNWGRSAETLARLDRARAEGDDVTIDVYPYTAGSTTLLATLPSWVNDGGPDAVLERLADAATRAKVIADLERERGSGEEDLVHGTGWDGIVVASAAGRPEAEGRSIQELADERGCRPAEAACDLISDARARVMVVLHSMSPDDVAAIRAWPGAMIGSDGLPFPGRQHPRVAGTFAKVLGEAARAGTLPDAVHRNTAMATQRFAIPDRGVVRVGAIADVVVLDQATVSDRATYDDPWATPAGIEHVFVAGHHAIRDGEPTGIRAGTVLTPA
jgi:N-acyl-D-aspartate/D-glutamate deacylase